MTAATLLRSTRQAAGLSLRALGRRCRLPHSRLAEIESGVHDVSFGRLEAILAAAGYRLLALPVRSSTAAEAAESIRTLVVEQRDRADDRALRIALQLHDDLGRCPRHLLGAVVGTPAALTGDNRFDALVAGIVEFHLRARRLPAPPWVREPSRIADSPWCPDLTRSGRHEAEATCPQALRRHGILLALSELESV